MHASQVTREVIDRANELYWGSDRSVNQIADDLELSKGALYGIIEPEPSGLGCPLCADEVVYPNRTAKERSMLDCPTCDWDGTPEEAIPHDDSSDRSAAEVANGGGRSKGHDGARSRAKDDDGSDGGPDTALDTVPPRPFVRPATTTIAGGALLGAAVGLALVMWARRR